MLSRSEVTVYLIAVASVCGRIAPGGLGSTLDRRHLEEMRACTDASLLGAGTLREGDAQMRGPGGHILEDRIRAVVTASGDIPVERRGLFRLGPPPVIFTGPEKVAQIRDRVAGRGRVVPLPPGPRGLSIRSAVARFAGWGARRILIEGGAGLNYAALADGVVDEVVLTLAPKISGQAGAPTLADGPGPLGAPFISLELLRCETAATGELFLRYRVRH